MNILIHGPVRSGKTLLAQTIKAQYESRGDEAVIYDDTTPTTISAAVFKENKEKATKLLIETHGNKTKHSICVMQSDSEWELDHHLLDCTIDTGKIGGSRNG